MLADPALGFVVVEEEGAFALPIEIQPTALSVLVEEGIDFLVRPEPTEVAFPEPEAGRRALDGVGTSCPARRHAQFGRQAKGLKTRLVRARETSSLN